MARGKKPPGRRRTPKTDKVGPEPARISDQRRATSSSTSNDPEPSGEVSTGGVIQPTGVHHEVDESPSYKRRWITLSLAALTALGLAATAVSSFTTVWNAVGWLVGWESKSRRAYIVEELLHRLTAARLPENNSARLNVLDARSGVALHPDLADHGSTALLKELEKLTSGATRESIRIFCENWPPAHVEVTHLDALGGILKSI